MKVSYSAAVTTNGVGDFSSKLVITGPESQVEGFIDGGFYIREVKGYNDRWTIPTRCGMPTPTWIAAIAAISSSSRSTPPPS